MSGPAHPIRHRIKFLFHNDRWRRLSWWRKAWYLFWDWLFIRVWRFGLRPHVRPRAYARETYRSWLGMRLPPRLTAYIWLDHGVYVGTLYEGDEPWHCMWFQGDDWSAVADDVRRFIHRTRETAGTIEGDCDVRFTYAPPPECAVENGEHDEHG